MSDKMQCHDDTADALLIAIIFAASDRCCVFVRHVCTMLLLVQGGKYRGHTVL